MTRSSFPRLWEQGIPREGEVYCWGRIGYSITRRYQNGSTCGPTPWKIHDDDNDDVPYILESNPHPFYSFRALKNQMRIRIACGLYSQSWAGFWKNYTAAVRGVRTIQYNNLLSYLLFIILYNIYNVLFIRLAVITHNWVTRYMLLIYLIPSDFPVVKISPWMGYGPREG